MRNPYIAAAWSYRCRLTSPAALICVIFALAMDVLTLSVGLHRGRPQAALPTLMALFFVIALVCIHVRQFAVDAKLRCLPKGAIAHVALFSIILPFMAVVHAMALRHYDLGPFSANLAVVSAVCAAAACISLRGIWFFVVAFSFLPLLLQKPELASKAWNLLADARHPEIPWVVIGLAIAWLVLELRHLAYLDEESWGYAPLGNGLESQLTPRSTMEASTPYRAGSQFNHFNAFVPSSRMIDRAIAQGRSTFLLVRSQRWQVMMPSLFPVLMAILTILPQAAIQKFSTMPQTAPVQYMQYQMVFMMLAMMTLASLGQQRRYLTSAILRPLTREAYFRELGTGMAITLARNLGITVCIAIPMLWLVNAGQLNLAALAQLTLADIFLSTFAFGWSVWWFRLDTTSLSTAIPGLLAMLPFMVLVPFWSEIRLDPYRPHAMTCCLLLALLGLYLTRDAYRRWLLTDLG